MASNIGVDKVMETSGELYTRGPAALTMGRSGVRLDGG
jgi:hypothetical protein